MMGKSPLVAVVDDDADVRVALSRLFDAEGFTIRAFGSPTEFLDGVEQDAPDCVILDLNMPGMSGFEVQAALARTQAALPVIVITAHDSPEARARALRLGAKDYFRKPADGDALVAAVLRAIDVPH